MNKKLWVAVAAFAAIAGAAHAADHMVSGYTKSNGTYVAPHMSANPGSAPSYGTGSSGSSHEVSGYTTQSGTYVAPYKATDQDSTKNDNYSTKGNVNPYTGQAGTKRGSGF